MPRRFVLSTVVVVLLLATVPCGASGASLVGTWSGGKTSEYYYFSPSLKIAKSGGRLIGTSTASVSWSQPQGQQALPGLDGACTIPANTHVLKLRAQKGKKNTYTGSVILIYNLLTTVPGQPTPTPFACQTHLYGATVSLASNGRSFRLRSMDGPETFPTVRYRKK